MDKEEIMQYINLGKDKSICIYRGLSPIYPGFVREIIVMREMALKVEYNSYGYDEGGLAIKFFYNDYDKLFAAIAEYIGKPIELCENISKSGWYPELIQEVDYNESSKKLISDLINNTLSLPSGWETYEIPEGYWKDLVDGTISI